MTSKSPIAPRTFFFCFAICVAETVVSRVDFQAVEECRADKTGARRDWLCHLAMQSVMSKHDCQLDAKYKLPKLG